MALKKTALLLLAATAIAGGGVGAKNARRHLGRTDFIAEWLKTYKPVAHPPAPDGEFAAKISAAALAQTTSGVTYDPTYFKIAYPGGDVPADRGVCTDVVIRAYRRAGVDLQVEVHEDMETALDRYPKLWGRDSTDPNIDHRRVPNLIIFFSRHGIVLPLSTNPSDFKSGDVVTWDLGGGVTHIGLVVDRRSARGERPLIVHNIGEGPKLEDVLLHWRMIGHFRFRQSDRETPD